MRTTIRLSDEAYRVADAVSRQRRITLGEAVSELILRASAPASAGRVRLRNGFPVVDFGRTFTSDDVRALEDDV